MNDALSCLGTPDCRAGEAHFVLGVNDALCWELHIALSGDSGNSSGGEGNNDLGGILDNGVLMIMSKLITFAFVYGVYICLRCLTLFGVFTFVYGVYPKQR